MDNEKITVHVIEKPSVWKTKRELFKDFNINSELLMHLDGNHVEKFDSWKMLQLYDCFGFNAVAILFMTANELNRFKDLALSNNYIFSGINQENGKVVFSYVE